MKPRLWRAARHFSVAVFLLLAISLSSSTKATEFFQFSDQQLQFLQSLSIADPALIPPVFTGILFAIEKIDDGTCRSYESSHFGYCGVAAAQRAMSNLRNMLDMFECTSLYSSIFAFNHYGPTDPDIMAVSSGMITCTKNPAIAEGMVVNPETWVLHCHQIDCNVMWLDVKEDSADNVRYVGNIEVIGHSSVRRTEP